MRKTIKMERRTRNWHNVQEVLIIFRESDMRSCVIQNTYADEWANEDSCLRSFSQALKRLGYDGLINVTISKNRIYLTKYFLAKDKKRRKKTSA